MANIHALPRSIEQSQTSGHIISCSDHGFMVKTQQGVYKAQQAFSCLLKPLKDDVVLVSFADHNLWIISILQRTSTVNAQLTVAGDLDIFAPNGKVTVTGQSIEQVASQRITQSAPQLSVMAQKEMHVCDDLVLVAAQAKLTTKVAEFKADKIASSVGIFIQNIKNSVRTIKETETITAGNIIQTVRLCFKSHAKNSVMTAKSDMKIDAKRIHMG